MVAELVKHADAENNLRIESRGFADGLDMENEREEGIKFGSKSFCLNNLSARGVIWG